MIDRFRSSGYSSLNVLKDYHFDELKIDMEFLRVFNDTSRKIITSVITTAPVALFSDDGTTLQMVYANDAYQKVMAELGFYSLEEINHKRRS